MLTAATAAGAQTEQTARNWSLRECISYALEHNISVKQQNVTKQQREIDLNTAKNSRLPDLNGSASQNWSFGRGLTSENTYSNTNTSSTSFSLGTSVPLFSGLKIPRTIELNKLNLEAATADMDKARNDISVQVAQAYVQILYDLEMRDVAQRQISIDSMQVARLKENVPQRQGKRRRGGTTGGYTGAEPPYIYTGRQRLQAGPSVTYTTAGTALTRRFRHNSPRCRRHQPVGRGQFRRRPMKSIRRQ